MPENPNLPLVAAVFDAYGTLFDVQSIAAELDRWFPRRALALARTWRERQIEYSRLRTLSDRYVPFSQVTRDALRHTCALHGETLSKEIEDALMAAYCTLEVYPEVRDALAQIRSLGLRCAILSNGDPSMLDPVVQFAGLTSLLDDVISVDPVRKFKTAPEAYALAVDRMRCEPQQVLFVSSNGWDVCGAAWFGFRTCWINRAAAPAEELGIRAEHEGRSLNDAVAFAVRLTSNAAR